MTGHAPAHLESANLPDRHLDRNVSVALDAVPVENRLDVAREIEDECGLDQARFDVVAQQAVDELAPGGIRRRVAAGQWLLVHRALR